MGQGTVPAVLLFFLLIPVAQAGFSGEHNYMLCQREAYADVVGERRSDGICSASAKIQAIAYECGVSEESFEFKPKALKNNIKAAEKRCEEFCERINSKCGGVLIKPESCGFTIPFKREVMVGREVIECPKHCKGQAFHYCSIYHGSFFGFDRSLFKNASENCHCFLKK